MGLTLIAVLSGCSTALDRASAAIGDVPVSSETPADPLSAELRPAPELSPEEVVKIQVEALQHNDRQDRGIEVTFRFASPDNKTVTGPLNRFIRLVKNPAYRPMLNHKRAEFSPIKLAGDQAQQKVTVINQDGEAVVNLWELLANRQCEPVPHPPARFAGNLRGRTSAWRSGCKLAGRR